MSKLKLVFSIGFDSYVYKSETKLFNKKFIGELQLLAILERELGLSGEFLNIKERQSEYLEYLTKEISGKDLFISASFKNDSIGVANELLRWRDQLMLCKWNFSKGISERLDLLAAIELNYPLSTGTSDRWILVLDKLKTEITLNIECIEVNDNIELLHPIFQELFKRLKSNGVFITKTKSEYQNDGNSNLSKIKESLLSNKTEVKLDENDRSFQIVRFKDDAIASDFLAQQLKESEWNPLILNDNNFALETSFLTFNIPLSGAEISNANPQIIQLFKLIGTLLFSRVNPYNLLSLLNLPMLPFPKSLANKLSSVLIDKGGIGNDEWLQTIKDFKDNIDKDKSNWKENIKSIALYIERERKNEVSKENLVHIYQDINAWAGKMSSISESEAIKTQLSNLQQLAKTFSKYIESVDQEFFKSKELDRMTNRIYEPITINVNNKEKGSHTVIKAPEQIYNSSKEVVWFDFYNKDLSAKFCDFLMQSEIEVLLKQESILFWSKEKQVQLQLDHLKKGVLQAEDKLVLFVVDKVSGKQTTQHPIYTQLVASISNFESFIQDFSFDKKEFSNSDWVELKLHENEKKNLPKQCDYIIINNAWLLQKRTTESYSSVNVLIQNPFDWVMNYQARITEKGLGNINELITLKGNLSHIVVQTLLENEKQGKLNLSEANLENEIDDLLEIFTPQFASPFFLDENTFEFKAFVTQLKKSVQTLVNIIQQNNLKYDSFEYKAKGRIDVIDFEGNIDLLFYKNQLPVIIDLKWTYSPKKYIAMLEEKKSIQLAMYSKLLNYGKAITGYFLLSDSTLYTTSNLVKGSGVKIIEPKESDLQEVNDRIITNTINSFNYRWNELSNGKIEVAEELLIIDTKYGQDTEVKSLIPLDGYKQLKKVNPYSRYGLFKGNVK
jgi:hypothetical protein